MNPLVRNHALWTGMRRILLLGVGALLLMSGYRLAFVLRYAHPELWRDFLADLPAAFLRGALHDLRIVVVFLAPLALSLAWLRDRGEASWRRWLRFAFWWSFVGIVLLVTVLTADMVFYSYFQSHFTVLAWGFLEDDLRAVTRGAMKIYPIPLYLLLIGVAATALFRLLQRAWEPGDFLQPHHRTPPPHLVHRQLLRLLTSFGAGILLLVVWPAAAPSREDPRPAAPFVHEIPMNGVEAFADAVWTRLREEPLSVATRMGFGRDPYEALATWAGAAPEGRPEPGGLLAALPEPAMTPRPTWDAPPHVVVVVMESFSLHLLRWQGPDFDLLGPLAKYWDRGILWQRFLPSDNGSAGSILSLISGLPYRPGTKQLSQSEDFHDRALPTAPARWFRAWGYHTGFVYGGPLTWRNLGEFAPLQGFDEVVGQGALLAELGLRREDSAGEWGIWDEHLFRALVDRLESADGPVFLMTFTTSNHPPHELPEGTELPTLTPPPGLLERNGGPLDDLQRLQLRTYQYACHRLGLFLDELDRKGLLDHTVVAVTGDHTIGTGIPFSHREALLERAVPFFLLVPDQVRRQLEPDETTPGGHPDVVPTVIQAAGLGGRGWRGLGRSLLDREGEPLATNPAGLVLGRVGAVLEFPDGYGTMAWVGDGPELEACPPTPEHERLLLRSRAFLALADWLLWEAARPELETRRNGVRALEATEAGSAAAAD